MPIYRLKCALRFKTGHAGVAFDEIALGADGPAEAIALAKMYRCTTPGMDLSVAVLLDEMGALIWSHRAIAQGEEPVGNVGRRSGGLDRAAEGVA